MTIHHAPLPNCSLLSQRHPSLCEALSWRRVHHRQNEAHTLVSTFILRWFKKQWVGDDQVTRVGHLFTSWNWCWDWVFLGGENGKTPPSCLAHQHVALVARGAGCPLQQSLQGDLMWLWFFRIRRLSLLWKNDIQWILQSHHPNNQDLFISFPSSLLLQTQCQISNSFQTIEKAFKCSNIKENIFLKKWIHQVSWLQISLPHKISLPKSAWDRIEDPSLSRRRSWGHQLLQDRLGLRLRARVSPLRKA